jgi:hypothetical protein
LYIAILLIGEFEGVASRKEKRARWKGAPSSPLKGG